MDRSKMPKEGFLAAERSIDEAVRSFYNDRNLGIEVMAMTWFWLGLSVFLLFVEIVTTSLVSVWFAAGSLAAALCAWLMLPIVVQTGVFALVSAVCFLFVRSWLKKKFQPRNTATNTQSLMDAIGEVTVALDPYEGGRVKVNRQDWKAMSVQLDYVPVGTEVKVVGIQGVTLKVLPVPVNRNLEHLPTPGLQN